MAKKSIQKSNNAKTVIQNTGSSEFLTEGGIEWNRNDDTLTLTIRPAEKPQDGYAIGQMKDYTLSDTPSWGTIAEGEWNLSIKEGVLSIGNHAFLRCSGFKGSLAIPDTVVSIGSLAFRECKGFKTIRIGKNTASIDSSAFYMCDGVESIYFYQDSAPYLGNSSFALSTRTKISCGCFSKGWAETEIPKASNQYVEWVFARFNANTDGGIEWVADIDNQLLLIRPAQNPQQNYTSGQMKDYTVFDPAPWSQYIIQTGEWGLVLEGGIKNIGTMAFYGQVGFYEAVIPDSVQKIGEMAFATCFGLKSVTIGEGVSEIGNNAFNGSFGIKHLLFKGAKPVLGTASFLLGSAVQPANCTCVSKDKWAESVIPAVSDYNTTWTFLSTEVTGGTDGGIYWEADEPTKTLTISASPTPESGYTAGGMKNYSIGSAPWYSYISESGGWNVVLKDGVNNIGENAFAQCLGLHYVKIGKDVGSIGNSAFKGSYDIKRIIFTSISPTLGTASFVLGTGDNPANCTCASPDNYMKNIVPLASDSHTAWTFVSLTNGGTDGGVDWNTDNANLILTISPAGTPESGYTKGQMKDYNSVSAPWESIVEETGEGWQIVLNEGITNIGKGAFQTYGKNYTGSLTIPSTCKLVDNNAFYGCSNLNGTLTIKNGVTTLSYQSFSGCSGLTGSLTIPASVTEIGEGVFRGCSGFTGNLTVPNFKIIGKSTFENCSGFTGDLVIPDSVTEIGNDAFRGCSGLDGNFKLGSKIQKIGNSAFQGCTSLTGDLVIPKSIDFGKYAFLNCPNFKSLRFDSNSVSVMEGSFCLNGTHDCYSPNNWAKNVLVGRVIQDTVFRFHYTGASVDGGIEWIRLNDTTLRIMPSDTPEEGYVRGQMKDYTDIGPWGRISEGNCKIVFEEGIGNIGRYAFYDSKGITNDSIALPDTITSIGQLAFCKCSGLTGTLHLPHSLTTLEEHAFDGCTGLKGSLVIPDSLATIGAYSFSDCVSFDSLILGTGVVSIGQCAFINCSGLTGSLITPDNTTNIGKGAFQSCSSLTELIISAGVVKIDEKAFENCPKIETVRFIGLTAPTILPESFNLEGDITHDCYSPGNWAEGVLKGDVIRDTKFRFHEKFTNIDGGIEWIKDDLSKGLTIRPAEKPEEGYSVGQMKDYTSDTMPWGRIEEEGWTLTLEEGITNIGNYAFYDCEGFTGTISIPDSVITIGDSSFFYCNKVTELTLGRNLETIGPHAFHKMSGITAVTVPASVVGIWASAFAGCFGMKTLVFRGDAVSMSYQTFGLGELFNPAECVCYSVNNWAESVIKDTITNTYTTWTFLPTMFYTDGGIEWEVNQITKALVIRPADTPEEGYVRGQMKNYEVGTAPWGKIMEQGWTLSLASGVRNIGDNAFIECSGFTGDLVIPDSVATIGESAFNGCFGLTSVLIGQSAMTIGAKAFYGCHSVATLGFRQPLCPTFAPESLSFGNNTHHAEVRVNTPLDWITKTVLEQASDSNTKFLIDFDNRCGDNLTYRMEGMNLIIDGFGDMWDYDDPSTPPWSAMAEEIISVTLPNGMTSIGNRAFMNTKKIKTVRIPLSMIRIGNYAFSNSGVIGLLFLTNDKRNGATMLGDYAFSGCGNLKSVQLPTSLTEIGAGTFRGCIGLKLLTLGSVATIGDSAFYGCTGLNELTLPNTVESVGKNILYGCSGITSLIFRSPQKFQTVDESMAVGWSDNPMIIYAQGSDWVKDGAFTENELGPYTTFIYGEPPIPPTPARTSALNSITRVGWIQSAMVYDECAKEDYEQGGIAVRMRFIPDVVLGVQVDNGHSGFFDIETHRLKIYKPDGTEGINTDSVKYTVVLMKE